MHIGRTDGGGLKSPPDFRGPSPCLAIALANGAAELGSGRAERQTQPPFPDAQRRQDRLRKIRKAGAMARLTRGAEHPVDRPNDGAAHNDGRNIGSGQIVDPILDHPHRVHVRLPKPRRWRANVGMLMACLSSQSFVMVEGRFKDAMNAGLGSPKPPCGRAPLLKGFRV